MVFCFIYLFFLSPYLFMYCFFAFILTHICLFVNHVLRIYAILLLQKKINKGYVSKFSAALN